MWNAGKKAPESIRIVFFSRGGGSFKVSLRNEGKRRFAYSFSHTDISTTSFQDFHTNCKSLFKVEPDYTVERIQLYNTIFKLEKDKKDTFSSFYARLSAQIALCNWPNAQERETLKDLFNGRILGVEVQQQLIKAKTDLDNFLKLALVSEKGLARPPNFRI